MKLYQLFEALKPSQYRGIRKAWDPKVYSEIFAKYKTGKSKYRIYLPLQDATPEVGNTTIQKAVTARLATQGYTISDYMGGYVQKDGTNRTVKIGKVLTDPELMQKFNNDPLRSNSTKQAGSLVVCISRHPYDIAGMSTDRGWTSCMDMVNGDNAHYVLQDAANGTLIAYLINKDDPNIEHPISRILIKPFVNADDGSYILVAEQRVYGNNAPGFKETVTAWLSEVNQGRADGVYCIKPELYADSAKKVLHAPGKGPTEILDLLLSDPKKYNVSEFTYELQKDGSINLNCRYVSGALLRTLTQYNIKIKKLRGIFDCGALSLTQLPSCTPKFITGDFYCGDNPKLTSLANAPSMVSGTVDFRGSGLKGKDVRATIVANEYEG